MIIRDRKKLITFDGDALAGLEAYSRRTGTSLRTLINEAIRDLLKKKGQPIGLKAALQQSARTPANEDRPKTKATPTSRKR